MRLSVHRTGRREEDPTDARGADGFENPRRGDCVLLEVLCGVIEPVPDIGVGLQVEDPIAALHGFGQQPGIENVAFDERHA